MRHNEIETLKAVLNDALYGNWAMSRDLVIMPLTMIGSVAVKKSEIESQFNLIGSASNETELMTAVLSTDFLSLNRCRCKRSAREKVKAYLGQIPAKAIDSNANVVINNLHFGNMINQRSTTRLVTAIEALPDKGFLVDSYHEVIAFESNGAIYTASSRTIEPAARSAIAIYGLPWIDRPRGVIGHIMTSIRIQSTQIFKIESSSLSDLAIELRKNNSKQKADCILGMVTKLKAEFKG